MHLTGKEMTMRLHFAQSRRRTAALVAAVAAAGALTLAACSTAATAAPATVTTSHSTPHQYVMHDNANGKTMWVHPGDKIELVLSSSYWQVAGSSAPKVVRQVGHTMLMPRPSTCPHIPGLGCIPVKTNFLAVGHGKAVIKASRTSCGEALRCSNQQAHFTLTIVVS
jgi:sorbitol-specific phosphotransferase system component IIA